MIDSILLHFFTGITAAAAATSETTATGRDWTATIIMDAVIGLVIVSGLALLQIFLSKTQSKWPGLVLPGCSIFLSLIAGFGFLLFTIAGARVILSAIGIFVLFNIPTLIYLAIYMIVRNNKNDLSKKNQEIQKMNIQDLE